MGSSFVRLQCVQGDVCVREAIKRRGTKGIGVIGY